MVPEKPIPVGVDLPSLRKSLSFYKVAIYELQRYFEDNRKYHIDYAIDIFIAAKWDEEGIIKTRDFIIIDDFRLPKRKR